jgi:hypothetical protein
MTSFAHPFPAEDLTKQCLKTQMPETSLSESNPRNKCAAGQVISHGALLHDRVQQLHLGNVPRACWLRNGPPQLFNSTLLQVEPSPLRKPSDSLGRDADVHVVPNHHVAPDP